jgi:C-terminal processing protease CtpA/Prc
MNFSPVLFGAGLLLSPIGLRVSEAAPPFREVYEVLRTNLAGMNEAELNQAAVDGLLEQLRGRASFVRATDSTNPALARLLIVDQEVAVARVGEWNRRLASELAAQLRAAATTNQIKGLVLDLRFAAGDDYGAVVSVAELFVKAGGELLDWGNGLVRSTADKPAFDVPIAVLVNRTTLGAPEALAGVLRENGVALVLGNTTAGRALAGRELTLSNGRQLRVAATPVKLGGGAEIPAGGLVPDIVVKVDAASEKSLASEPYGSNPNLRAGTNAPSLRPGRTRRPSEADLVRERRNSTNELETAPAADAPAKPVIVDPVLARAVDLFKGLAVIRRNRS